MNIRDLVIDAKATIGENLICVDVVEKAVYKDGVKTDETIYSYDIVCIDRKMLHINVKIPGKQLISLDGKDVVYVSLTGLVIKPYLMNNQLNFTATATSIVELKN